MFDFITHLILGILFSSSGAFLIGVSIYSYIKGKQSLKWLSTRGEIIKIDLENVSDGESIDYRFIIKYKFIIDNIEYFGNKVFHMGYESESIKYSKKYYLKKQIDVFYNFINPNENDIEFGIDYHFILGIFFGVIILIFGLCHLLPSEWLYFFY